MLIRCGYEITYDCVQATPMLLMLTVHPSRFEDLRSPHQMMFDPPIEPTHYRDGFGNVCTRILAPAGRLVMSADFRIADSGLLDTQAPDAVQHPVEQLPDETLVYLLASRYCETEQLSDIAWAAFGHIQGGWNRALAIRAFAHERITFGYQHARPTKTAWDAYNEQQGVCRDFAHLAVTLCRCMNIPARYCTGYLGDIGVPISPDPMDFSAWYEVYLGGTWHTLDARHNHARIGRIVMARGRDAADVAITTTFGKCTLAGFEVITDEIVPTEG